MCKASASQVSKGSWHSLQSGKVYSLSFTSVHYLSVSEQLHLQGKTHLSSVLKTNAPLNFGTLGMMVVEVLYCIASDDGS